MLQGPEIIAHSLRKETFFLIVGRLLKISSNLNQLVDLRDGRFDNVGA